MIRARRRRQHFLLDEGLLVPVGIGISPTMKCNLSCEGCYSKNHPREDEMGIDTLDSFISSAAGMGVFLFVITGGEPYLLPRLIDIYRKNRGVFFLTVTNGTLIDDDTAATLSGLGNIFPVVSIEGSETETDARRGEGVYRKVLDCMQRLNEAGVPFGFSSVVTRSNISTLGSTEFIRAMIGRGCKSGFFNDYIPLHPDEMCELPDEEESSRFRKRLDSLKVREPIVLVHLPHDEYDRDGRCLAVDRGAFHVNSQGYVEPCPFAHYARENIKDHSFRDILSSPFLEAIRSHPTALQKGAIGCSLVNNYTILQEIAGNTGARPTEESD
jgi:MoaA/NifB/PqqE/SkfB family radical SAM enzyme